jgi:SAM-dependent methyltransferase
MCSDASRNRRAWVAPDPGQPEDVIPSLRAQFPFYEINHRHWLPTDRKAQILDYGCGGGGMLLFLVEHGFANVTGFDVDARYAEISRRVSGAHVAEGDPETFLAQNAGAFDVILCREVAYYFPRTELFDGIARLGRALVPGGRLLLEVFNPAGATGPWPYFNDPWIQTPMSEHAIASAFEYAELSLEWIGCERHQGGGVRHATWRMARAAWISLRRAAFVLERGRDPLNPRLFGKKLIAVATRPERTPMTTPPN